MNITIDQLSQFDRDSFNAISTVWVAGEKDNIQVGMVPTPPTMGDDVLPDEGIAVIYAANGRRFAQAQEAVQAVRQQLWWLC